ncbi:MAG: ABC transporter ATP-binding protein [Pirellulaceae bacterium]
MAAVQICEIQQRFGGKSTLRDVSLDIPSGSYVVLLGPSGCGKTTLLKIVAGLLTPDHGTIKLDDQFVDALPPRKRDISFVFQNDSLYPHLTIRQSIVYGLAKLTTSECDSRIADAGNLTGVTPLLDRRPENLSGGELRRAAIAKAIARRAAVRLLDEPLSALDAHVRHEIQDALVAWHHQHPGTTIHVTHDGHEAMRVATHIAVLANQVDENGFSQGAKIVQFASPHDVYQSPANKTVALSLGTPPMNFLRGKTEAGTTQAITPIVRIESDQSWSASSCREVDVGFRAQSCELLTVDDTPKSQRLGLRFQGIAERQYFSNGRLYVVIRCDDDMLTADVTGQRISNGQSLKFSVPHSELHWFDGKTGEAILDRAEQHD